MGGAKMSEGDNMNYERHMISGATAKSMFCEIVFDGLKTQFIKHHAIDRGQLAKELEKEGSLFGEYIAESKTERNDVFLRLKADVRAVSETETIQEVLDKVTEKYAQEVDVLTFFIDDKKIQNKITSSGFPKGLADTFSEQIMTEIFDVLPEEQSGGIILPDFNRKNYKSLIVVDLVGRDDDKIFIKGFVTLLNKKDNFNVYDFWYALFVAYLISQRDMFHRAENQNMINAGIKIIKSNI